MTKETTISNKIIGYAVLLNGEFYNNKVYKSESTAKGQLNTLLGDVKSELGIEGGRKHQWYFGLNEGNPIKQQELKDLEQAKIVQVTYK
jgi:hypothetical protein